MRLVSTSLNSMRQESRHRGDMSPAVAGMIGSDVHGVAVSAGSHHLSLKIITMLISGELRIAFDFDGVIADDAAEAVYHANGQLDAFHHDERQLTDVPHNPGPLATFLKKLSVIQDLEQKRLSSDAQYRQKLKISIVTARNAPSHQRVVDTMRAWEISVNEAFFLGGVEKRLVLEVLQPHIFFDDQRLHLDAAAGTLPCVHIPFGVKNSTSRSPVE